MLGLRFAFLKPGEENWLVDGTADWLWPAAERAGLPIGLLVPEPLQGGRRDRREASRSQAADRSHGPAARHARTMRRFGDLGDLLALAKYPNVAVKATGRAELFDRRLSVPQHPPVPAQIFDAFGPQRMFWGTDITRMPCTWRQCVTMFTEELPWLKGRDLELVMGRALCDWIGWKVPAGK